LPRQRKVSKRKAALCRFYPAFLSFVGGWQKECPYSFANVRHPCRTPSGYSQQNLRILGAPKGTIPLLPNSRINVNDKLRKYWLYFSLVAGLTATHANAAESLVSQINALQGRYNIQISGLEKIQNAEITPIDGNVEQQIKYLLSGYNHVVGRDSRGKINRLVILNKAEKSPDQRILLPINQQQNHSTVTVSLTGDGRNWQTIEMVMDTGADLVVLPDSMIPLLGINPSDLAPSRMQTANGVVQARTGQLREIRIAGERVEQVDVAFVADRQLGDNRLLGMSLLNRFQVSIDEKEHLVTLIRK
jgi:aspartyl protease family protein